MAPRKNAKGGGGNSSSSSSGSPTGCTSGGSSSPGARRETKQGGPKNGRKGGLSGSSFFTWFMVIALLGVWTSVAVVWFDLVDYEEVLGKLGIYDADGDGDFDVDDAKVLLGEHKRCRFDPWVGRIHWRREWQPILVFLPGETHGQRGSWRAKVHRVAKSQMQLKQLGTHILCVSSLEQARAL